MTRSKTRRRPGRPRAQAAVVSREAILEEALSLLESGGLSQVTMRSLAQRLGVDAMAPYHYFRDKDEMLRAAATLAYSRLKVSAPAKPNTRKHLTRLALAYVALLSHSHELLRYLSVHDEAATTPAQAFDIHFRAAVQPLALSKARYRVARDAFVDFLHGFSLGARSEGYERALKAELTVVLAGIEALASGSRRKR